MLVCRGCMICNKARALDSHTHSSMLSSMYCFKHITLIMTVAAATAAIE